MVDPHFPVLGFSDVVLVYPSAGDLLVTSEQALKDGYHDRLELVDLDGSRFRIAAYERVREAFWKRPRTPFGRGVRLANMVFERTGRSQLEELQQRVARNVREQSELWEAGRDVPTLLAAIDAASDIAELVALLGSTKATASAY